MSVAIILDHNNIARVLNSPQKILNCSITGWYVAYISSGQINMSDKTGSTNCITTFPLEIVHDNDIWVIKSIYRNVHYYTCFKRPKQFICVRNEIIALLNDGPYDFSHYSVEYGELFYYDYCKKKTRIDLPRDCKAIATNILRNASFVCCERNGKKNIHRIRKRICFEYYTSTYYVEEDIYLRGFEIVSDELFVKMSPPMFEKCVGNKWYSDVCVVSQV